MVGVEETLIGLRARRERQLKQRAMHNTVAPCKAASNSSRVTVTARVQSSNGSSRNAGRDMLTECVARYAPGVAFAAAHAEFSAHPKKTACGQNVLPTQENAHLMCVHSAAT